jgi:hypothetical protein
LTIESEEEEAWTAGSLRMFCLISFWGDLDRKIASIVRYSGGHVTKFIVFGLSGLDGCAWDSSRDTLYILGNRIGASDQPALDSQFQLESLILAQNERWRQA